MSASSRGSAEPVAYSLAARQPERVVALVAISGLSGPHLIPGEVGRVREAIFLSTPGQKVFWLSPEAPRARASARAFLNDHLTAWGS